MKVTNIGKTNYFDKEQQLRIRPFNFILSPTALRILYGTYEPNDSINDDFYRSSLNYSRSFICTRTFNNTIRTLCLLPKEKDEFNISTTDEGASTTKYKNKKIGFVNSKYTIRNILQRHMPTPRIDNINEWQKQPQRKRGFDFKNSKKRISEYIGL